MSTAQSDSSTSSKYPVVQGAFAQEFEKFAKNTSGVRPGKTVTGRVTAKNNEVVHVDIGFKSEGVVPVDQFKNEKGEVVVNIGDSVDVFIIALENDMGQVVLSKEKADQMRVWSQVEDVYKSG